MKKAMLIVNPTSGGAEAEKYIPKIEEKLMDNFDEVEVKITQGEKDATNFAKYASENSYDSVFAVGGDGTVNEVIAGLAENEYRPKLGVIPGGTVNLLGRVINMPMSIDEAIDAIDFNNTTKIDVGKYNGSYFSYILSIGKISEGIHNVGIDEKTKFGPFAYAASILKNAINDQVFKIKVETEVDSFEGDASHVAVILADYFGDIKIVDTEDDSYGYANVMILKDSTFLSKLTLLPDMIKGTIVDNNSIEFIKAKNIKISSIVDGVEVDVDGDKGGYLPVEIKVLKKHLEVYSG